MNGLTYYEVLKVARTATAEEIRQAFRTLSKKHHPDVKGDPETFKFINEAYQALSDPKKRSAYDANPLKEGFAIEVNPDRVSKTLSLLDKPVVMAITLRYNQAPYLAEFKCQWRTKPSWANDLVIEVDEMASTMEIQFEIDPKGQKPGDSQAHIQIGFVNALGQTVVLMNVPVALTLQKAPDVTITTNPSKVDLGKIWPGLTIPVQFELTVTPDPGIFSEISCEWWFSSFPGAGDINIYSSGKKAGFFINVVGKPGEKQTGVIWVSVVNTLTGDTIALTTFSIMGEIVSTKPGVGLSDGKDSIRFEPLEKGQTNGLTATIINKGSPIWEPVLVEWATRKPDWVSRFQVNRAAGQIFPINLDISVATAGCDVAKSPFTENLVVKTASDILAVIPVVLVVKKVPVPELKVYSGARQEFGTLIWDESQTKDIKIESVGDPLKTPVQVRIEDGSGWLSAAELWPTGLNDFPKTLRLTARGGASFYRSNNSVPVDCLATVRVSDGVSTYSFKVTARLAPQPIFQANPPSVTYSTPRGYTVSGEIEVTNVGGDAKIISVGWERDDYCVLEPKTSRPKRGEWPLTIEFKVKIDRDYGKSKYGERDRTYRNALLVSSGGGATLRIPIEFDIK